MDRCNRCSDEQRNDKGRGNPSRSIPELLDELAELVGKLPPERQVKLMEELEQEAKKEGGDDNAEES